MSQKTRLLVAIGIVVVLATAVLVTDALRRQQASGAAVGVPTLAPGAIPIYVDGSLLAGFSPADLASMDKVSFVDAEDDVQQEGWLLRDILRLHLSPRELGPDTQITVSSSSRNKSAQVTWAQVDDPANFVMFDLANRGTLKLVSLLDTLNTRDEWVQDVDKIEVATR